MAPAPRQRPRTEREQLEVMFDKVMREIEERQEFLAEMEGLGRANEHRHTINAEIKERVRELSKIDALIKSAP